MRIVALLLALMIAAPAAAQSVMTSDHVDQVSVTLYRDPGRAEGGADPNWPVSRASRPTGTRSTCLPG
ncbi:MAG: hypothetical protein JWM65_2467 [Sphingomonas bacterium]|nr:hypothetical protein [Sphingomonas bacterium]